MLKLDPKKSKNCKQGKKDKPITPNKSNFTTEIEQLAPDYENTVEKRQSQRNKTPSLIKKLSTAFSKTYVENTPNHL